jgi:hypothetical protein
MLALIFIPQVRNAIAEKFNLKKDEVKKVVFFINKASEKITITCNDEWETVTESVGQLTSASKAIESAIKKQINGELVAYSLEILIKEKQFNAEVFIIMPNGEKVKQEIKNII